MYYWPELEQYNFSTQEVHRVNLFGDKTDIKQRLMYIFELNKSVFEKNSYWYSLETLIGEHKQAYTTHVHTYQESIKKIFETELYRNSQLLDQNTTDHHIIFKNKHNNWHLSHTKNLVPFARWVHTSFHELMNQKMLFPHQQFTRLMKLEKKYVTNTFRYWLQELEQEFDRIYKSHPYEVYKRECFRRYIYIPTHRRDTLVACPYIIYIHIPHPSPCGTYTDIYTNTSDWKFF